MLCDHVRTSIGEKISEMTYSAILKGGFTGVEGVRLDLEMGRMHKFV